MEPLSEMTDVGLILRLWEENHQTPNYDPAPTLTRLAEIIELGTESYMKMDPDPFDERHPSRADPDCSLGHSLKVLFRKDAFMTKLVNDYLRENYWTRSNNTAKDSRKLNVAACRLMLDILPGLESSAVFQVPEMESMIHRLFVWSEKSIQPLQCYATGLLAAAMEVQDVAANFRDQNAKLVPLKLQELHKLEAQSLEERRVTGGEERNAHGTMTLRPFAHLGTKNETEPKHNRTSCRLKRKNHPKENGFTGPMSPPMLIPPPAEESSDTLEVRLLRSEVRSASEKKLIISKIPPQIKRSRDDLEDVILKVMNRRENSSDACVMSPPPCTAFRGSCSNGAGTTRMIHTPPFHKNYFLGVTSQQESSSDAYVMSPPPMSAFRGFCINSGATSTQINAPCASECSNSSWAEMGTYVIGNIQMYPPSLSTQQMLILRYLTPMGEYQEFLGHVFEHNSLELILKYTNVVESKDSRLAFEALKYLAALLCHKKFSLEFIYTRGLQSLLQVPRPSVAATGVSICLYYLSYCEDAMERVSQLAPHIITELVKYALWLLECSHASGRCHATMFFGLSFQFRVILNEFDAQDGLRKFYNTISTLPILSLDDELIMNDDEESAQRQVVRHVCVALKRYLEAHLLIKADHLRRTHLREAGSQVGPSFLPAKIKSSPEEVQEQIQTMLDMMPFQSHWEPVDELLRLGGVTLLLQVIAFAYEWNYGGRAETVRSALDVLAICSVMPQVQMLLCDRIELPDEGMTVGMNIVLGAGEGEIVADPDVQRAALSIIVNCVCAPIHRTGGTVARFSVTGSTRKKMYYKSSEDIITKIWESVRSNNGIMVLLQLMMLKTPITDADSIRALACRALVGLSRSETVRQIISKLPLFTNGQLQMLMRDPILQDRRQEHVTFQRLALELMERVSGKSMGNEMEISLSNMHRANVVAQTRIHFNDKQLYQLIHQHLLTCGLTESAMVLQREANLPGLPLRQSTSSNLPQFLYRSGVNPPCSTRPRLGTFSPGGSMHHHRGNQNSSSTAPTPRAIFNFNALQGNTSQATTMHNPISQPIKFNFASVKKLDKPPLSSSIGCSRSLQKQISWEQGGSMVLSSPVLKSTGTPSTTSLEPRISLDSIITEYLTNQHALCKNPMVPCPQFNLFEPHKCPDPKAKNTAPINFATRISRRHLGRRHIEGSRLDRKLVHSRFCPIYTFRLADEDESFTCCQFQPCNQSIIMGTSQGDVKLFNIQTGSEEATFPCHDSFVHNLQASKRNSLLLTSTTWHNPLSALWKIDKGIHLKFSLNDEEFAEFGKVCEDRIIGTKRHVATIFDVTTAQKLLTLTPTISNQYTKNRATFNPTDELILSDGVLWDVNSGKEIHKLDKLNQMLSGVFHPNGLEVVSNTEVWDLRTFHLLRTVPALDQKDVKFSRSGDVIYSIAFEQEMEDESLYDTSFKTFDASNYSSIATIDVRKNIAGLSVNKYDTQLALVENQGMYDSIQESIVRLYDVGRRRDDEDEEGEEDDDDDLDDGTGEGSTDGSEDDQQDDAGAPDDNEDGNADNNAEGEDNENENEDEDDDNHDNNEEIDEEDDDSGSDIILGYNPESDDLEDIIFM